jgi:hypothetical protein
MAAKQVRVGAKGSRISSGGTFIFPKNGSVTDHADKEDSTSFEDNAKATSTVGVEECDLDGDGDWQAQLNYYDAVPGIYPRDDAEFQYYININDGTNFSFPVATIVSSKVAMPVRGLVSFNWSGFSNGDFTRPSG